MDISPHEAVYSHQADLEKPEKGLKEAPEITAIVPYTRIIATEIKIVQSRLQVYL